MPYHTILKTPQNRMHNHTVRCILKPLQNPMQNHTFRYNLKTLQNPMRNYTFSVISHKTTNNVQIRTRVAPPLPPTPFRS